ncbi:MAG TPA: cupin domain-containing protein [Candidatus Dormibacteraeota bacterium]
MTIASGRMLRKNLDAPDETRPFKDKGQLELVTFGDASVGRATFRPGWRWSEHVAPIAQTRSCQAAHEGYVLSGRMLVRMDDGAEEEYGPGDVMIVPPGHDAWVLGSEACVVLDWAGMTNYAKR